VKHYDLVVVGSGVGLTIVEEAIKAGRTCAFVERGKFGGTCLTRGCIPSKVLVYPADLIRESARAAKIGLEFQLSDLSWETIGQRMWDYINKHKLIEASLDGIDALAVYRGTASFTSPYTMQVADEKDGQTEAFQADRFVLAAGARTFIPPIQGLADAGYITSETFFGDRFPDKPWKSLVIIGGGAIGAEFAHIFSAFGTQVTIVEMADHLVPTEEAAISTMLEDQFKRYGIRVLTGSQAISAEQTDSGKMLTIRSRSGNDTQTLYSEEILVASGVRSNADCLHVERAGLATDSRGYIITNEYLETNQKNIWALGDINGKLQFRHKANYEAVILAHNMFRPDQSKKTVSYHAVPWAIFTSPQIAHLGLREDEVRERGIRYQVGINRYSDIAKGYAMGYAATDPDNGFVKLLADEHSKILGVHIVGPHAAILIQSFVYLMNAGFRCTQKNRSIFKKMAARQRQIPGLFPPCSEAGTLNPIARSMVIHPALSELAGWVIGNLEWVK